MLERSFTENVETSCDFIEFVVILIGIDFLRCLICYSCWRFVLVCGLIGQIFLSWCHHAMGEKLHRAKKSSTSSKSNRNDVSSTLLSVYVSSSAVKNKGKLFLKSFCTSKILVSFVFALIPRPEIGEIIVSNEPSTLYDNVTGYFKLLDKPDVILVENPNNRCTETTRFVLMVLSSPDNVGQRYHLRNKYNGKNDTFMLFLLGTPHSIETQVKLEAENLVHGDLLQGSVEESYKTLSYKTLLGFIWSSLNCGQASYIIKIDDNVNVDLDHLTNILDQKYGKDTAYHDTPPDTIQCSAPVKNMRPWRHSHTNTVLGKWSVTLQEMPRRLFPDFCFGWLYVTTPKVGLQLAEAAVYDKENVKIAWRDDQYITGFLRERLPHVKIQQINPGWTDILPCPYIGITANVFFNEFVLQKSSGQVAYVGGAKFYWCIFLEFFILEKLEKLFPFSVPDMIWDACAR